MYETIDQYILRLRRLVEPCKFEGLHDDMVRDRLVLGARDKAARARLFREKECNLKKAIESLRISEVAQEQLRLIGGTEEETVNVVTYKKPDTTPEQPKLRKATKVPRKIVLFRYCGGKHHQEK